MHNQRSASQPLSLMDMAEALLDARPQFIWTKDGGHYVANHKTVEIRVWLDAGMSTKGQPAWGWTVKGDGLTYGQGHCQGYTAAKDTATRVARASI